MNLISIVWAKKPFLYFGLLLVCLYWGNEASASPITAQMRQQDTRLEKPVNVIAHRLYVGELLEYLSRQSGVVLSASEKDGTANERISVAFRNLPLADALNAIQSLYTYQGSAYRWIRSADSNINPQSFSYRFSSSPDARAFASTASKEIQQDFAKEINGKIAALGMSPEERRKATAADPTIDMTKRGEAAMGALSSMLSPEQFSQAIENGEEIRIPTNQFGAAGDSFIASEEDIYNKDNPGLVWHKPDALIFQRVLSPDSLTPTLFIFMEYSSTYNGMTAHYKEGYGWAGGAPLENRWKKKLNDAWHQNSDSQPTSKYTSDTLKNTSKETNGDKYSSIQFQRLRTLSQIIPIGIVARLPYNGSDPGSPVGTTLPAFLQKLSKVELDYKWSGSVLVVTYQTWIRSEPEEEKTPWSLVKSLRASCASNSEHVLSLSDLCAASVLTPVQLQKMSQKEQWHFDYWPNMKDVSQLQPLLSAFNRNPSLMTESQSTKGIPISILPSAARALLDNQPFHGTRLRVKHDSPTVFQFNIVDDKGNVVSNYDISLQSWIPDPSIRLFDTEQSHIK